MSASLHLALAQVAGDPEPENNLHTARSLAGKAAETGADCIVFPEMFMALPRPNESLAETAQPLDGPFAGALATIARECSLYLAAGLWERIPGSGKVHNTAVIFSPDGALLCAYRKLHLFDALNVRESDTMQPGGALPEVVAIKGVKTGLAICYDLRFPELFRHLARQGAELFIVPSAWYAGPVKEEQWRVLLRARAMENTCYAAGVNLTGTVFSGRSALVDPFGIVCADAGEGPQLVRATVDTGRIREVRERLPVLKHRRPELFDTHYRAL